MTDYTGTVFVQFPAMTDYVRFSFVQSPAMTDYIRFCMCSVSGHDLLDPVLHLFSFRQWRPISGSAFVQFPAMRDYIRFWICSVSCNDGLHPVLICSVSGNNGHIRFCIWSVSDNDGLHPVLHLFSFRQWHTTSGSEFCFRFPAMTDYICIWTVSGNDGLHPVLHLFSFRQWRTTSGSAFVQFPAMTYYVRFWILFFGFRQWLTTSVFGQFPVTTDYIRFCICSVSGNDGLHPVLLVPADSRGPPPEAGRGQAGVWHLSQEVPVQPSSPGIPTPQSSSLGTPRTCSRIKRLSKFRPRVQGMTFPYLESRFCHVL